MVYASPGIHSSLGQGAVMNSKFSIVKSLVVAAALAAGASGMARADDSSMSRFGGESDAYFNQPTSDARADSAWRQSHPNGYTQLELERFTSRSMSFQPAPVLSNAGADPTWRQSHPNGSTERELQSMSSEAPAWHQPDKSATGVLASTNDATNTPSASREPFGARIARFFHITPVNQATPAN
jgi:hypothetical protein